MIMGDSALSFPALYTKLSCNKYSLVLYPDVMSSNNKNDHPKYLYNKQVLNFNEYLEK